MVFIAPLLYYVFHCMKQNLGSFLFLLGFLHWVAAC